MLITASFVSAQEMCTRSAECRTQHIERICGTREPCTGRSRPARTLSRPRCASARCACRMLQLQSSQGAMLCLHLTRPWISLGSQKSRRVQHVLVIVLFDMLVLLYQWGRQHSGGSFWGRQDRRRASTHSSLKIVLEQDASCSPLEHVL